MSEAREARAAELRASGLPWDAVAAKLGVSQTTARRLANPEYAASSRAASSAAKRRRTGTCEDCGALTRYEGHARGTARRCVDCAREANRRWTPEEIVRGIQEWDRIHGKPPVATDWLRQVEGSQGSSVRWTRRWPNVQCAQRVFGSWSNAIRAAGFEPLAVGQRTPEGHARMVQSHTKWTPEVVLRELRVRSQNGLAPAASKSTHFVQVARTQFGSWEAACDAAGVEPRRRRKVAA